MEHKWSRLKGLFAGCGLLILIFDSRRALLGAASGVELCIKTVIPALFPFFVLSMLLTDSLIGSAPYPVKIVTQFLGIPKAAAPALIPSVLGGYPVGAKCIGDLYQKRQISREEAQRLLAFSNLAGPSFLFGMVSAFFPEQKMLWLLWLIQLTSAALTAMVFPSEGKSDFKQPEKMKTENTMILSAAKAMAMVCCWVILFRMVITFFSGWFLWMFPVWVQVLIMGFLELTNGCCELLLISDLQLRFVMCACMLSFGGICVLLQTASVIKGLSLKGYIKGKILQTFFSLAMSAAVVSEKVILAALVLPMLVMILRKIQKKCRNPRLIPV